MIRFNAETEVDREKAREIMAEIEADAMGGWLKLPMNVNEAELAAIKTAAKEIQENSEVLVCIGIGGSYLGHRAVIQALEPKNGVEIVYAGNSLSRRELLRTLERVGERDFTVNVISKSGTTLEPAMAFQAFKEKLTQKYGQEEAARRIYATTDARQGTLHDEAVREGYRMFVVPDNIGGRYSVMTAVGLLPMAAAGVDIDAMLAGARECEADTAIQYAFMRDALRRKGYDTEVFSSFEPAMGYFNEWLKQLFGESEGKNKQGVWPASVVYSTDLHSLGQFMQDGRRNLWETIIEVPTDELNAKVVSAVKVAHAQGGIPVLSISESELSARGMGELMYFFEVACAVSAKLAGVNPFDQPGVEAYKKELRRLMGLEK